MGHPTSPMLLPSIQNAGHMPWPRGSFIRVSTCPYVVVKRPEVFSRAEVYWQLPYQHWYPAGFSLRAVMTRWPWPSRAALRLPAV